MLALSLKEILKKLKFSRLANQIITFGTAIAVPMLLRVFSVHFIVSNDIEISTTESQPVGTYQWKGMEWDVYNDAVPLKLEDFMEVDYDGYSYRNRPDGSFLLSQFQVYQEARAGDTGRPELTYRVVKVHADFMYDMCFDQMFKELDDSHRDIPRELMTRLITQDAAPWQADAVYRVKSSDIFIHRYLICYDDKIVSFMIYNFDSELTEQQMGIIGDRLKEL